MKRMKKVKKMIMSVAIAIMLLLGKTVQAITPRDCFGLYGPPKPEESFIESIWKTIKTYIFPISIIFVFIVGSIIFFKKSKEIEKETKQRIIFILFIIVILIILTWYYIFTIIN